MNKWNRPGPLKRLVAAAFLSACQAASAFGSTGAGQEAGMHPERSGPGYVARQENMRAFFGGVSSYLGKPIIVSKLAAGKQISGEFNFADGDIVGKVSRQLGLITYHDGYAIYVYDASETRNSVIRIKNLTLRELTAFLRKSGLADPRYPLRSNGVDTFYLAGPPVYVDLVTQAAEFMDNGSDELDDQRVEVIRLNNTFVTDRAYTRREENIVIPGIATVVEKLLTDNTAQAAPALQKSGDGASLPDTDLDRAAMPGIDMPMVNVVTHATHRQPAGNTDNIRIIAYPETNSLLVKGTTEQVRFIRNLVEALDEEKRHIELALWIIDLEKDDLDQLGVNWQGAASFGDKFAAGINSGTSLNAFSTLEGTRFIASILALTRENKAQIVSRPVVLTQENTPAMFDNNRTFYTPLIAERAVELQKVTYGTLIHVLPRFTARDDIELSLNIEDGSEVRRNESDTGDAGNTLPTVGRTRISTVARVPKGKSLLVGGYTRGESGEHIGKIPLLGDLPFIGGAFRYRQTLSKNTVRVFLIRPREITEGIDLQAENLDEAIELQELIRHMDKTRETARRQQESLFNGS